MTNDYSQSDISDIARILISILDDDALPTVHQKILKFKREQNFHSLQKWQRIADALEGLHIGPVST